MTEVSILQNLGRMKKNGGMTSTFEKKKKSKIRTLIEQQQSDKEFNKTVDNIFNEDKVNQSIIWMHCQLTVL